MDAFCSPIRRAQNHCQWKELTVGKFEKKYEDTFNKDASAIPLADLIREVAKTVIEDRLEAINDAAENITDSKAQSILKAALEDSFYVIRMGAIQSFNPANLDPTTEKKFLQLASSDPSNEVKEQAIDALAGLYKKEYKNLFTQWTQDSSYIVSGAALDALEKIDSSAALKIATEASTQKIRKRLSSISCNYLCN